MHQETGHPETPAAIVLAAEKAVLDRELNALRRNDLLLLGDPAQSKLMDGICISRTFFLDPVLVTGRQKSSIQADFDELPVRSESMDIVLCAHALDRVDDCHAMLQEIHRVLNPDGSVILFGFNQWSVWRFCHFFTRKRFFGNTSHFHSVEGIVYALESIGFEIKLQRTACFRPPFQRLMQSKRWFFLEALGQMLLPFCGAIYTLVATKNVLAMTPLVSRPAWVKKINGHRVAEPTTYNQRRSAHV